MPAHNDTIASGSTTLSESHMKGATDQSTVQNDGEHGTPIPLRPIPKERLKYQKYVVYGDQQQEEVDDALNSSTLSFEDASRLHSSAIAMETATIAALRNEKWHLSCEIDQLKRDLGAQQNDNSVLLAKVDTLQAQYEQNLRMLKESTEGEIRKESLRTKELELMMHHKDQELKEALVLRDEKDNKELELWKQKATHFENELRERQQELESVRSLHRKSEQRLISHEGSSAEKAMELQTLQQTLAATEDKLAAMQRELDERRTGAESLRAHSDRMALEYNDMKTRNELLEDKIKSLTEQNNQLIVRNKSSQSTFEDLQEKGSQVRRSLEEKVQQYASEMEKLKLEALDAAKLRDEIVVLKERIVGLSEVHRGGGGTSDHGKRVTELELQVETLSKAQADADYWKDQHTIVARDIARYQATNASNAVTIEGLEAQLAAMKTQLAEQSDLAAARESALELERRGSMSMQESLVSARSECQISEQKLSESKGEVQRLTALMQEFETERKSWASLHVSFVEAKSQLETLGVELRGKDDVIAGHLKTIEMLQVDAKQWNTLQENYLAAKAKNDELSEECSHLRTGLDASKAKLEVFEREKVELIGTLATVSKEWEQKNHKIAAERKKEMTSIEGKISELQAEVVKLTDRNTLLSADKVRYQQLQREWDEHMITCNNRGSLSFAAAISAGIPTVPPIQHHVINGSGEDSTLIKVQCNGCTSSDGQMSEAQRAHLMDLQEKNKLLARLAGLHEAMEKIRYDSIDTSFAAPDMPSAIKSVEASSQKGDMHLPSDLSNGTTFPSSVEKATSGIRWEGWSSYYLRPARLEIEPLAPTCTVSHHSPIASPTRTQPAPRPHSTPAGGSVAFPKPYDVTHTRASNPKPYEGTSKGMTPGLGINREGYHSANAVASELQRRRLHFGDEDDGGLRASMLTSANTPGRTAERDPWVGDGFEQQIVMTKEVINTPISKTQAKASAAGDGTAVPGTSGAGPTTPNQFTGGDELGTADGSSSMIPQTVVASASSFGIAPWGSGNMAGSNGENTATGFGQPAGPPPCYIPTPSG